MPDLCNLYLICVIKIRNINNKNGKAPNGISFTGKQNNRIIIKKHYSY